MSSYLMVKQSDSAKSIGLKDSEPTKPYIAIKMSGSTGYLPLTTETSGTGIKIKGNNTAYKIVEVATTTTTAMITDSIETHGESVSQTGSAKFKPYIITPTEKMGTIFTYGLSATTNGFFPGMMLASDHEAFEHGITNATAYIDNAVVSLFIASKTTANGPIQPTIINAISSINVSSIGNNLTATKTYKYSKESVYICLNKRNNYGNFETTGIYTNSTTFVQNGETFTKRSLYNITNTSANALQSTSSILISNYVNINLNNLEVSGSANGYTTYCYKNSLLPTVTYSFSYLGCTYETVHQGTTTTTYNE